VCDAFPSSVWGSALFADVQRCGIFHSPLLSVFELVVKESDIRNRVPGETPSLVDRLCPSDRVWRQQPAEREKLSSSRGAFQIALLSQEGSGIAKRIPRGVVPIGTILKVSALEPPRRPSLDGPPLL